MGDVRRIYNSLTTCKELLLLWCEEGVVGRLCRSLAQINIHLNSLLKEASIKRLDKNERLDINREMNRDPRAKSFQFKERLKACKAEQIFLPEEDVVSSLDCELDEEAHKESLMQYYQLFPSLNHGSCLPKYTPAAMAPHSINKSSESSGENST